MFGPLVQDGPHTQVSFRIAFSEKIAWPRKRAVFIIADSEFNLTICPVEEIWAPDVDLGSGVRSLWTGTACVATVPGRVYGLPIVSSTKAQFVQEVKTQLFACQALNDFIREANGGRTGNISDSADYNPWWLRWAGAVDDVFYSFGVPHVLTVILIAILVIMGWSIG